MKIYYFIVSLLLPIIMLCTGVAWRKKGPVKINALLGYRTERSMKNQETWQFAHRCVAKIWFKFGLVLCAVTAVVFLFFMNGGPDKQGISAVVLILLQIALLFASIPMTERQMKDNFDEYGRKKHNG